MGKKVSKDRVEIKNAIEVNQEQIKGHLNELVRQSVEETLNGLLDAEADRLCNAKRYERVADRVDTRAGHYERGLQTQAGEVALKVPKLRTLPFETQIIERYRRRESSVEEALLEMYYAGVSMRRVEDITDALWGARVSPSTISDLNQKVSGKIDEWRNRPLTGAHVYVWLDAIWLKRSWAGEVRNVSVLVAIGVGDEGYRKVLGVQEGMKEDKESWSDFLKNLRGRGLPDEVVFSAHAPLESAFIFHCSRADVFTHRILGVAVRFATFADDCLRIGRSGNGVNDEGGAGARAAISRGGEGPGQ